MDNIKQPSTNNKNKVGIMYILRKHLRLVTTMLSQDRAGWQQSCNSFKYLSIDPTEKRTQWDKESVDLRNQGNEHFKAGRYPEARLLYTQSLASGIEGSLGALAYSNRSAALFHMRLYKDCIKDIDRALVLGYPNHQLKYNLHLRKAMCLQFLKKDHTEELNNALMAIDEYNKDDSKALKAKVFSKLEDQEPIFNIELPKPNSWKLPDLSHGPSEEVPSFSRAVSIAYSKELGRHLVANIPINTGDVLIVEECIVAAVSDEVHREFCGFCFKPCMSLIPCMQCGLIMYCSVSCRDSDWTKSHEQSCLHTRSCYEKDTHRAAVLNLSNTQLASVGGIYSFDNVAVCVMQRLILSIGIEEIQRAATNNEPMLSWSAKDPRTRGFRDGKFATVDLEALISLEDNFDKLNDIEKACYAKIALTVAGVLKIPDSALLPVAAVFLKLILVMLFNRKYIHVFKTNYYRAGHPRIALGDGMYLAGSLINHACDPSIYQVSYGTHAVYRARRPIETGEQLTDCYIMSAANEGYVARQLNNAQHFRFHCKCEACEKDYPDLSSMPRMSIKGKEMVKLMKAANLFGPKNGEMLRKFEYFCNFAIPADKEMLSKMVALLGEFYKSGTKMPNQWFYMMQESIKNHYRTQGSGFFIGDSEEILMGTKKFNVKEASEKIVNEQLVKCTQIVSPFGVSYLY